MIPPVIVTIYGNVGVGKSTWARKIEKLVTDRGMSAVVSDHELFAFDKKFQSNIKYIRKAIEREKPDFGVIVVGTGLHASPPFKLEIEHQGFGANPLYDLFF